MLKMEMGRRVSSSRLSPLIPLEPPERLDRGMSMEKVWTSHDLGLRFMFLMANEDDRGGDTREKKARTECTPRKVDLTTYSMGHGQTPVIKSAQFANEERFKKKEGRKWMYRSLGEQD